MVFKEKATELAFNLVLKGYRAYRWLRNLVHEVEGCKDWPRS